MHESPSAAVIGPARREEMAALFRLLFQHLPEEDRETRVANGLKMLRDKELNASGAIVARAEGRLQGALFCQAVAGASGLIWPPQTQPGKNHQIEDQLIEHACQMLTEQGAKLVQSLLIEEEKFLAGTLERNGFNHITQLWYMRRDLKILSDLLGEPDRLEYQPYSSCAKTQFNQTLLRTYESTQDCPEVNGVRGIEEVIAGHKNQGRHDPNTWWLAFHRGQPIGVLMIAEMPDMKSWELLYVGVVREARGKGFGRELVLRGLLEARALEAPQLTLSVDARNQVALKLYKNAGFEAYDQRDVYLRIFK
jgi:ribosomal protein S18 acetylase RimI-like enzyme